MSLAVTRLVWELPWPAEPKLLALALADIVNEHGLRVFCTVETIARKTRLSARSVQRFYATFRQLGFLIEVQAATRRTPTHYGLDVVRLRGWIAAPATCPAWPNTGRQGRQTVTPEAAQGCPGVTPEFTVEGRQGVTPPDDQGCPPVHSGVTPATIQGCQGVTQIREEEIRESIREKDSTLSPESDRGADLSDPGLPQGEPDPEGTAAEPITAAELQQRFVDHRTPDGKPLRNPEAEWTRCRAYYAKRDPGPQANWHTLVDGWLENIDAGYAQAGEDRRGPKRVDRGEGDLTSVGSILLAALARARTGGGG